MNPVVSRLQNILYFHYRLLTVLILCIGGVVATGILYVFLYTSPPIQEVQQITPEVAVKQDALNRVLLWNEQRALERNKPFVIDNSVFAIKTP